TSPSPSQKRQDGECFAPSFSSDFIGHSFIGNEVKSCMICRFFLDRGISQQTHIQCVGKGFGVLCIQATAVIAERVLNVLSDFRSYFLAVLPEWGPPPDVRSEVLPFVVLGVLPVYIKPHQLTLLRHRIPQ